MVKKELSMSKKLTSKTETGNAAPEQLVQEDHHAEVLQKAAID